MAATDAAKAVEAYLNALRDPSTVVDSDEAERLEAEMNSTDDVLERVRLAEQLRQVQDTDAAIDRVRQGFVDNAKKWAESQTPPISGETFRTHFGVPTEVLSQAGFGGVGARSKSGGGRTRRSSSGPRGSMEDVLKTIEDMSSGAVFKYNDLEAHVNASLATVRKAVGEALEKKLITDEGEDPDHSGRGRAPKVFKRK